jgi:hypothetical protein
LLKRSIQDGVLRVSDYAVPTSLLSAAAFVAAPGLSFTWHMNLPVPCNKRAGSGTAALKEPHVYVQVNTFT